MNNNFQTALLSENEKRLGCLDGGHLHSTLVSHEAHKLYFQLLGQYKRMDAHDEEKDNLYGSIDRLCDLIIENDAAMAETFWTRETLYRDVLYCNRPNRGVEVRAYEE